MKLNPYGGCSSDVWKSTAGKVSNAVAKKLAEEEFEKFRVVQDREFESDFEEGDGK